MKWLSKKRFLGDDLKLDCEKEVAHITNRLKDILKNDLKRRGFVIAISGGIDSSVTAALCVKALGSQRVITLQMPERHSTQETVSLSNILALHLGVESISIDISNILETVGFYEKYDAVVQSVIHEYGNDWKSKIVLSDIVHQTNLSFFTIVAQSPKGNIIKQRLPLKAYLEIVAATN